MKLEKREIIILVIMAVVVLLGIYMLFIAPSGKKSKTGSTAATAPAAQQAQVKTGSFAGDINAALVESQISDFDKYVVKRAGMDIRSNPFIKKDVYREWLAKDNKAITGMKLIYSGYVDSKKDIIAIINGIEYRAGEKLAEEGFILKHIMPSKVLIFDKRSGTSMEIPIQE
jgi:hypothetical protein